MSPRSSFSWLLLAGLLAVGCGGADESTSNDDGSGPPIKGSGGKKNSGGSGGSAGGAAGSSAGGSSAGGSSSGGSSVGGSGGTNAGGSGQTKDCSSGAECDDGNECTNDTCSGGKCLHSPIDPPQTCGGGAKVCKGGACVDPGCGDGIKQDNEECDDGNNSNFDACTNACTLPKCGDGVIQQGEDCDDQNADDSDGCTSLCKKPGTSDGQTFDPGGDGSQGVKLDEKGNIIIDPNTAVSKVTKPVIWIANSGEGTISKIDTQTLQELARYCTAPGCKSDPSRTTVGLSGDAVVANRAKTGTPSAARIATDEINCIDRNGNGVIDTWKGVGPVPPQFQWKAGQPFSPDECVLWWTDLSPYGTLPRAAGFDAEIGEKGELSTFVYVGLYGGGKLLRLDGTTGAVVKDIKVPGNPYGLVVDKDGNIWIQAVSKLVKVDVKNGDAVSSNFPVQCMYGITADPQGRIYTSGYGDQCLRRYDPASGANETISLPNNGGGVAIDQNGHLWTGQKGIRIDTNGPLKILGTAKTGGHGWAIDYDGFPWSIPINGNQTAYKHDPASPSPFNSQVAKPGQGTYTYSDMTGFQLINAASKGGLFRKTFQGCAATALFESLDLKLLAPPGTVSTISARVAPSVAELPNAQWQKVATLPPDALPIPLNLTGGAIQIEVAMKSQDLNASPILSSMTLNQNDCGKELPSRSGTRATPPHEEPPGHPRSTAPSPAGLDA